MYYTYLKISAYYLSTHVSTYLPKHTFLFDNLYTYQEKKIWPKTLHMIC